MKVFLYRVLYFISVPLLLILTFELIIYVNKRRIFSEENLEPIFRNDCNQYTWVTSVKADSIIFLTGSSSVKYGISCSILNTLSNKRFSYINIAADAGDPIRTYFLLKCLPLDKVHAVYFGLDPWIYSKKYYKYRNSYLYLDFDFKELIYFSYNVDKIAPLKRYVKLVSFIFHIDNSKVDNSGLSIPSDFGSVALDKVPVNFNEPVKNWFQTGIYGWSELQFSFLQKISEICDNQQITFAVFVPPKRSDYSLIYKKELREIHEQYLDNLSKVHFASPIFGTFDQLDSLVDDTLFAEAFHLNKAGQKIYSKLFYDMTMETKSVFSKEYQWFNNAR